MHCHCPKGKGPGATGKRCSLYLRRAPQCGPSDLHLRTPHRARHKKGRQVARGSPTLRLVQPQHDPGCHGYSRAGAESRWIREGSGPVSTVCHTPVKIPTHRPQVGRPTPRPVCKRQGLRRSEEQKGNIFRAAFFFLSLIMELFKHTDNYME